jgi:hypothetical protein
MNTIPTTAELSGRFGGTWSLGSNTYSRRWDGVVDRSKITLWQEQDGGGSTFVAVSISDSKFKVCEIEGPDWTQVVETALELARIHQSDKRALFSTVMINEDLE